MRRLWPTGGLWRHADFLKLWSAETISRFGVAVLRRWRCRSSRCSCSTRARSRSRRCSSSIEFLPFILFALPAGVWVDRLPRRPILVIGDLGRAVAARVDPDRVRLRRADDLAALRGRLRRRHLHGLLRRRLPVVPARRSSSATSSSTATRSSRSAARPRRSAGPGVAGGLIALLGAPVAVLLDAISFVVSALFLFAHPEDGGAARARGGRAGGRPRACAASSARGCASCSANRYLRAIIDLHRASRTSSGSMGVRSRSSTPSARSGCRRRHDRPRLRARQHRLAAGRRCHANRISARLGVGRDDHASSAVLLRAALLLVPLAPDGAEIPFFIAAFGAIGGFARRRSTTSRR